MAMRPTLFTRDLSGLSQSSDPNSPNVGSPAEQRDDAKRNFLKAMRPLPTQHYWHVYFDNPRTSRRPTARSTSRSSSSSARRSAPSSRAEHADFVSILDPDGEGAAAYDEFLAVAALKLHARADDDGARAAEVDEAFRLFAGGRSEGVITLGDLKRVAAVLKEDVDEAVLRDMVLEANAGAGVQVGVGRAEFEEVMRRAGAWK
ncbi:hypothetical protein BN1708_005684 [Verticillium longisporum]|uniref:EF-hand domain-containing protein n=1 Tax=Verticillium longisporum TaxID=100787 RepID=A0A0G4MDE6_VERLO|nr:hypothetical protein BN1708_005684 [Verticillium longisporum]